MKRHAMIQAGTFMKIAIDAHAVGSQASGNETYYRQLVSGFIRNQTKNQYTLFYTCEGARQAFTTDSRFDFVRIPANPVLRISVSLPLRLRRMKPDLFHCQYIQPPWGKTRTVVTIHDLAYEHHPECFSPAEAFRSRHLVRWTARRADHILTVSEFCAGDIATKYEIPREKITVARLSASEDFRPRDKQQCQEHLARKYKIDPPFMLYVGRLQARKNLPRLVEAYSLLRNRGQSPKLVLVGKKDWEAERLTAKIKELGIGSEVVLTGFVSYKDLPLFYNAAELFVFPSFFEGFGLPVIESMASGVPTVTSFGTALEEVAGNGALLTDPYSVHSIADAMEKILADEELRLQLITRGLRRSSEFKASELAEKVLKVYQSLQ